jgi:hypothetical protein
MNVENGASNCSMFSPEDDEFAIYGGAGGNGTNAGEVGRWRVENSSSQYTCSVCGQQYFGNDDDPFCPFCSGDDNSDVSADSGGIYEVMRVHGNIKILSFLNKCKQYGKISPFSARDVTYDGITIDAKDDHGNFSCEVDGHMLLLILSGTLHNRREYRGMKMSKLHSILRMVLLGNQGLEVKQPSVR